MRIDFRPSGRNGQRDMVGNSSRVPMPIIRSVVGPQPVGRRHGQPELMRVGDDAAAAAERHDRRVDHLGQLENFLARMDRAAADKDHRRLAAGDQRRGVFDAVADPAAAPGTDRTPLTAPISARCVNTSQGISSATGPRRPDIISWNARDTSVGRRIGIFDAVGPFDESAQRRELIRHLVQMAAALAEKRRRHLPGQAQHRLVRSERGEQRSARVEHAGAGHHAEHARPAARARIAVGHVAAGLLVPRADHLELRLMEGVEQAVDLRAGQAEHGVDAVGDKAADDRFAAGHGSHCHPIACSQAASSTTPLRSTPMPSASTSIDVAGLEIARRIEPRAGAGRRSRDDDVAGHQRGEGRDVVDEIAEAEDQPRGAVVLPRLAVDARGQPDVRDLRFVAVGHEPWPEAAGGVEILALRHVELGVPDPVADGAFVAQRDGRDVVQRRASRRYAGRPCR